MAASERSLSIFRLLALTWLVPYATGVSTVGAQSPGYELDRDLPYYDQHARDDDPYLSERCRLDVYYPTDTTGFSTIVWFHAGGLSGGEKHIPELLMQEGVAIVAVNYRLAPRARTPAFIEDAAAAVAWTLEHIGRYGGDERLVFVSGHSAGGYLAAMIGLDPKWLAERGVDANRIAGLVPMSGHMITHFQVRSEKGIPDTQPVVDEYAPLFHVRPDAPPVLLMTGDREMEMLGRYEENAYMMRMMRVAGHERTRLIELEGYGHDMTEPGFPFLIQFVRQISSELRSPSRDRTVD